jgi:dinuclear metal center YbgI/SA1388 family protein
MIRNTKSSKRTRTASNKRTPSVGAFCEQMEAIAPTAMAQEWDNVGLLAGDPAAPLRRVLLCIDLTRDVVLEAVRGRCELVMAYHPPIFKPLSSLRADSNGTDALVWECIRNSIAIYTTHTALDAADGGTCDVLARWCGIRVIQPIEYVDAPGPTSHKLVVFVPPDEVESVAGAMFDAGAGHIGDYSHCSYRLAGTGTFLGGESTRPTIGKKGRLEYVDEVRLETVVPGARLPDVVTAMIRAHSYEEPAYDICPLHPNPTRGIGRWGRLPKPIALSRLARKLKRATPATSVQIVGPPDREIRRAVVLVGAAGTIPFRMPLSEHDAIITGEIRHHDALTIHRRNCTAIALGHWASERPALDALADRLAESQPGVAFNISDQDRDPLQPA